MKTKLVGLCVVFFVCASIVPLSAENGSSSGNYGNPQDAPSGQIEVLSNDLLRYIEDSQSCSSTSRS